jgi:hypothetical protein
MFIGALLAHGHGPARARARAPSPYPARPLRRKRDAPVSRQAHCYQAKAWGHERMKWVGTHLSSSLSF